MNAPDRAVLGKPALTIGAEDLLVPGRPLRSDDSQQELSGEPGTHIVGKRTHALSYHPTIIA